MLGVGFTRIVNVWGLLEQSLRVAITCTLLSMGELEMLVEVKAFILPVPEEDNPVLILLFVQFMVLPVKFVPVKLIAEITAPAQTSWDTIGDNVGAGLITN
jgi:hypothetical protein